MNDFYLTSEEKAIMEYGSSIRDIVTNNLKDKYDL